MHGVAAATYLARTRQILSTILSRLRSSEPREDDEELALMIGPDSDDEAAPLAQPSTRTTSEARSPPYYLLDDTTRSQRLFCLEDPIFAIIVVIALGWAVGLYLTYPFPTTIPIFVALFIIFLGWTFLSLSRLSFAIILQRESTSTILARISISRRIAIGLATVCIFCLLGQGFSVPQDPLPTLPTEIGGVVQKYFVVADLHNNEGVLAQWSDELVKLLFHLGRENTFVSIYESNSQDSTKHLLSILDQTLSNIGVEHRIITTDDDKHWWPYSTSAERIVYLANARNIAMRPLQSEDDDVRLADWESYTKVVFLNDIWFLWQDIVRLLATKVGEGDPDEPPDYDLACAMDFGWSGIYDTWVARDICGTPFRAFWPYVKDQVSVTKLRKEEPFEVSACWNGAVAFASEPFLYQRSDPPQSDDLIDSHASLSTMGHKRGWKMIDNPTYPGSRTSPPLHLPIKFRASDVEACDHSECFLFSYDLHRLYNTADRPPRIYMNPQVRVAYEENWWKWHTVVLRVPVVRWWVDHWSRGLPLKMVDWIWEFAGRRRDYCTWAALASHAPDRCPPLPGPLERHWNARGL